MHSGSTKGIEYYVDGSHRHGAGIAEFSVNGEAFVVVPLREYEALRRLADTAEAAANEADALRIHEEHLSAKARGEALFVPAAQWKRVDKGASPCAWCGNIAP